MGVYQTSSGEKLDLTPDQAKIYKRVSEIKLISEGAYTAKNVRDVSEVKPSAKKKEDVVLAQESTVETKE